MAELTGGDLRHSGTNRYHQGELQDHDYPAERIEEAMAHLPKVAVA